MMKKIYFFLLFAVSAGITACGSDPADTLVKKGLYLSPEALGKRLLEINSQYPDITSLETTGSSIEGRPVYVIIISDNPSENEQEPRIRLTGTMHGTEVISGQLLIDLIDYLTENYASDDQVRELVDNRYICLLYTSPSPRDVEESRMPSSA